MAKKERGNMPPCLVNKGSYVDFPSLISLQFSRAKVKRSCEKRQPVLHKHHAH